MRKRLQIGEVAQLLGVTTKTIRHYHKVGLLQEPERTTGGYRLYGAQELGCLRQIRHLQMLGCSLKQIKAMLGEPAQSYSLRDMLQALDTELAARIRDLEERRAHIQALLNEDEPSLEQSLHGETVNWLKSLLGEHASQVDPQAIVLDAQLWDAIEHFQWPSELPARLRQVAVSLADHFKQLEGSLDLYNRLLAISSLPEDAPEVLQLIDECERNLHLQAFLQKIGELSNELPALESPFSDTLQDLMLSQLTPTLKHFFSELERRYVTAKQQK